MSQAISQHPFRFLSSVRRLAINRVRQAIAHPPERVIGALTSSLFRKKEVPLIKSQKQAISLLAHVALTTGSNYHPTQEALMSMATSHESDLKLARHAITVGFELARESHLQARWHLHRNPENKLMVFAETLAVHMADHHIRRLVRQHLFATYRKIVPMILVEKDAASCIAKACTSYLESGVMRDCDELNVLDVLYAVAHSWRYPSQARSAVAEACKVIQAGLFNEKASKRALVLASVPENDVGALQKPNRDLHTCMPQSPRVAKFVIENITQDTSRHGYPAAVLALPDAFTLAHRFKNAGPLQAAWEVAQRLLDPDRIRDFLNYRVQRPIKRAYYYEIVHTTKEQRDTLCQAFRDISGHEAIPDPLQGACQAIVQLIESDTHANTNWGDLKQALSGQAQQTMP